MSPSPTSPIEGLEAELVEERQSFRAIRVTIPADEYEKATRAELAKIRRKVTIRGFRKGKAPWTVVDRAYGAEAAGDAADALLKQAGGECLARFELRPVAPVTAAAETDERGGPLVGRVEVSVDPGLESIDADGLEVRAETTPVQEEQIQAVLENIRRERAQLGPVGPKGLADGDVVEADLEETELDESGEPRHRAPPRLVPGIRLGVGEDHYHPALHEALQGARDGDTVTATVRFDARIPDQERAGRAYRVRATVKQALSPIPPPIDDAFAQALGKDSLLALRGDVRDRLREENRIRDERALDARILEALREKNPVEPPPGVVEQGVEAEVREIAAQLARSGRDVSQDEEAFRKLIESVRARVEADVAYGILLDTLVRQEGIEHSEEEFDAAVEAEARARGQSAAVVRAKMKARDELRLKILLRRAAARRFLRERATIHRQSP